MKPDFAYKRYFFCLICMLFLAMSAAANEAPIGKYSVRLPECVDRSAAQRFQLWCDGINKMLLQKIEDNPVVVLDENAPYAVRIMCMDMQDGVLIVGKISEIETGNVIKTIRHEASIKHMQEEIESFTGEIVSFIENGFTEKEGGRVTGVLLGFEGAGTLFLIVPGVGGQLQILWVFDDMKPKAETESEQEQGAEPVAVGISAGAVYYFDTEPESDVVHITADVTALFPMPGLFGISDSRLIFKIGVLSLHKISSDSVKSLFMVHNSFGIQLGGALDEDKTVSLFFTPSLDVGYYYDIDEEEMVPAFLALNLGLTLYFNF
ncbi:MAG: hypothetical protein JW822_07400 [Spirochaetales bacterium]|nr:hypothetical protein [Spirochaetales bacterium]